MRFYLNYTLLILFLVLPKFPILGHLDQQSQQGILIGEVFLLISFLLNIKSILNGSDYWRVQKLVFLFYIFLYFYVLNSSMVSGLLNFVFPTQAFLYFARLSIYLLLPYSIVYVYQKRRVDYFWYSIIKCSYLIHALLALLVYVYYYLKFMPAFNDSIWTVEVGYRLLPLVGLAFNPFGEQWLYPIGGGSSNLLGTWTVFFILAVHTFETRRSSRIVLYSIAFLIVSLSQTRGGLLTLIITLLFTLFAKRRIKLFGVVILLFSVGILSALVLYFDELLSEYVPIFVRLVTTFSGGSFDGSTSARFSNYLDLFYDWISNPMYLLSGLGFDENLLLKISGWSLVESFYLSVIFSGGLLSIALFIFFLMKVWQLRNNNEWLRILYLFLMLNSLVNWSITGADILSVVGIYPILFSLTLGTLKKRLS